MGWLSKIFNGDKDKKPDEAAGAPDEAKKPSTGEGPEEQDGQERGPAGRGFVETKSGKFGRKKVIETNLGPDGKPVYTASQMESAMARMKARKKAREQAKKEEKAYVEYRKAEILRQFQPKVGTLRLGDEAYPKRRRVGMGFGERKAHYLAIRPKPKYATWIGRKKGIIEAKAVQKPSAPTAAVVTDHSMLPDHSVRQHHTKREAKEEGSHKETETKETTIEAKPEKTKDPEAKDKPEKNDDTPAPPKRKIKLVTSNKNPPVIMTMAVVAHNHMTPEGAPYWCAKENEELADDDLPVDMDILEKVCSGEKVLSQRPFNKTEFIPFGPIAVMKQDDVLFVRDTLLFANTVESVISLQPEDDKKKKLPPPIPYKITWSDDVRVIMFHPVERKPHKLEKSWHEKLFMFVRTKSSKAAK